MTRALLALALFGAALAAAMPARAESSPDPLLAYYYIWFNAPSWNRAKLDYPRLGRYSSDERSVLRQHVRWAKRAGIDGFIVGWKSTPALDRRLERLVEIADAERFKLVLIYQALDFHRRPLPAARVARDLALFRRRFARHPAFDLFGKPVVIWSGTPKFSRADLGAVAGPLRGDLLVLASEKNTAGLRRVAGLTDGDAYYWTSVDPRAHPAYAQKLKRMGAAVHARGGLWIPPAAPGFDARLVGGRKVVPRRGGDTLRRELSAAAASSPDAVGLISWNEFSENTYVEPSRRYGSRYLRVVADARNTRLPALEGFDSSEPPPTAVNNGLPLLAGLGLVVGGSVVTLLVRRARRRRRRVSLRG